MGRRDLRRLGGVGHRGLSTVGLRMLGLILISVGLLIASMAFVSEGLDFEGVIVIFPFVFRNVSGGAAIIFTIIFFSFFILTSLLPWYIFSRRSGLTDRVTNYKRDYHPGGRDSDTMEYIITTELPRRLRKSIYIEADGEEIHLRSTQGEVFLRSYSLPRGFEVDEIDYDYEGDYLVLKLMLKRSI